MPFMNKTTGAEATAASIALRVSVERKDFWSVAKRGERSGLRRGRSPWAACEILVLVFERFETIVRD